MGDVRKSVKQVEARKRAREKAAAFRARHDQLEQLAAEYFVAADTVTAITADTEQQIAALREKGRQQAEHAQQNADAITHRMLALGITRAEVAARLGIATRDVKKHPRTTTPPPTEQNKHDPERESP